LIPKLRQLVRDALGGEDQRAEGGHDLRLATASLLLEMARADQQETAEERRTAEAMLAKYFALERGAAEELLARADDSLRHAVSLYEFTSVLNDTLSAAERRKVVEMVGEVAATDGRFDKHEQHLLSKLADLLHLRRAEYATIRASLLERGA
jgi:uncharacterized tellurite resistance protein B-like protein